MLLPVSVGTLSSKIADDVGELSFEGYELVGTATCARVNVRSPSAGLTKLWIDAETYLIRHIIIAGGLMHETTISYEPSIAPIVLEGIVRPNVDRLHAAAARSWFHRALATKHEIVMQRRASPPRGSPSRAPS